ncbi:glycosyltransferase [Alteromonas hispanica]|uniref:Glycosyltransferase n=1 Tax=Alteromonas hispanica TaxID=315421 RepID=A0A6L9MTS2_9ALTE|nr:glycosyltransferase [Alteromonas hispanica]NDW21598.1 glycosyltransferase [Alteromonas hispanica]
MAKPRNITVVSQRVPYPPNKGEKLRTYHQVEFLTQLGYQVDVLCLGESEQDHADANALREKLNISVTVYPLSHKVLRYSWAMLHRQAISVGAFYSSALQKEVNARLRGGCDALLLSASSLGYYVFNAPHYHARTCALFMDMMDVDSDKWRQYAESSSFLMSAVYRREGKLIKRLEARANKDFEDTFLIAKEETRLFEKTVSALKPVKVLGNGLDFSAFYPAPAQVTDTNFLFTGVMDYKPNVDAVMWFVERCWPSIKQRLPGATFTVGGMNPTKEIQQLSERDKTIEVTGFVDDMLPYFHKATAFVAPFRIARGVQNKMLQAAACKLPVISTSMGAEGINYANESTMFIVDEESSFIDACVDCVKKADTAQQLVNNAYSALHNTYSWEQQLKPLKQALKKYEPTS